MTDADRLTLALAAIRDILRVSDPYARPSSTDHVGNHIQWTIVNDTARRTLNSLTRQDNAR